MKRTRDDSDSDFLVWWQTRDGRLTSVWPRSYLAKYSGFFAGLFRSSHIDHVEIKMPYPKDIVKCLFRHLDGESINVNPRQQAVLEEAIDFLILEPPFDVVDNQGFERNICGWCTQEMDNSICKAKRWRMLNDRQQCAICCEQVQFCECDWVSMKLPHDDDPERVRQFQLVT